MSDISRGLIFFVAGVASIITGAFITKRILKDEKTKPE